MSNGPLHGIRTLEIAGIGPGPFCGMVLADLGADVVRIDRPNGGIDLIPPHLDLFNRGKRSVLVDMKTPEGVDTVLSLAEQADIMFEAFRPGVAERLGIGPEQSQQRNPALVYGRMTGWGQDGPLAHTAGHDIDYIALAGPLHAIGPAGGPPMPPLSFVGDNPGALYLAIGLLAALFEARASGRGQVIDAAIVDGSAHFMTLMYSLQAAGAWRDERGVNLVDGGAPFYGTYMTSDGKYMALGAIEREFFEEFAILLGLAMDADHLDRSSWPALRACIAERFASRTQDEWITVFDGSDACVTPVLSMTESQHHWHMSQRKTYIDVDGVIQPAPAPRFSRTTAAVRSGPCLPGEHTDEVIKEWLG